MRFMIDLLSRLIAARVAVGESVEGAARDVLTKLLPHPESRPAPKPRANLKLVE